MVGRSAKKISKSMISAVSNRGLMRFMLYDGDLNVGDVPCSVEKGEAGMVGLRGQAASLMVSMALFAFACFT